MSTSPLADLSPQPLWQYFADISSHPRASKREEVVRAYIIDETTRLGLVQQVDDAGNVLVRKPATAGDPNGPAVALQSHLDMVHQKNASTTFDFDRQGIEPWVDGDWVRAKGTTLGADNGIGVAAALALLAARDLPHPPLEALFTIDEETGMSGAKSLKSGWLKAAVMLNLDTEQDSEVTIGCAGGVHVTGRGRYALETLTGEWAGVRLTVKGLTGGHSGMDIHLGRGNANKLIARLLWMAAEDHSLRISQFEGGGLSNAIPREAFVVAAVGAQNMGVLESLIRQQSSMLRAEHRETDPGLQVVLEPVSTPQQVLSPAFQSDFLTAIRLCPNGIHRLTPQMLDLVQTSTNLARIQVAQGEFEVQNLCRSSVDSEKADLALIIRTALERAGASVALDSDYPGWEPKPHAGIVRLMRETYHDMFGREPHVTACHAGLECGIIASKYPHMEIVSFGPNIRGAHSPDECVQISSVHKFWSLLLTVLNRLSRQ